MLSRHITSLRFTTVSLALIVAAAACGGGSNSASGNVASLSNTSRTAAASGNSTASVSPAEFRKQLLAYSQCMRDNGVTAYPDPQFDTNGNPVFNRGGGQGLDSIRSAPGFDKARTACQSKRPNFAGQFARTPAEQAALRKNLLKFAQCMRSKGVNYPDPTFDANGRPQFTRDRAPGGAQGQNRDDPKFQANRDACRQQVGGNLGGGGGGRGLFGGGGGGRAPSAPSTNGGSAPATGSN